MGIQQMFLGAFAGKFYEVAKSLRFNDDDTAHLVKATSAAGDPQTFTVSFWLKKCLITSGYQYIFTTELATGSYYFQITCNGGKLQVYNTHASSNVNVKLDNVFRDPAAWYHIVLKVDTTQSGDDSNRLKWYVNGVHDTDYDDDDFPAQNYNFAMLANKKRLIGSLTNTSGSLWTPLDGMLAEFHYIDGTALDASSFGKTSADTGQWVPIEYTGGSYGTNGFYLNFSNTSDLGEDLSGNNNDFTATNFSTSAGYGNDVSVDTPTPFDDGGNGTGNYCTMNPVLNGSNVTLSEGNLQTDNSNSGWSINNRSVGTIGMRTGKWYWECHISNHQYNYTGMISTDNLDDAYPGATADSIGMQTSAGTYYGGGAQAGNGASTGSNVTIMYAFDADNKKMWYGVDGTWLNTGSDQGNPSAGTYPSHTGFGSSNTTYFPANATYGSMTCQYNFGARSFAYTPPTGFKALNTYNLDDTTILSGEYKGNGSADGPVIWMNATPATLKIGTSDPPTSLVTFDDAVVDRLSNGFKIRHASTNNGSGTTYYWLATTNRAFKYANAQTNA